MSSSPLLLRQAEERECLGRDHSMYEAWGKKLTLDQYMERNHLLRSLPYARKNMRSWVLEKDGVILCSCETFQMKSMVAESAEEGFTDCLASFYVEPGYRGKGYAAEMLIRLTAQLRKEKAQASILFSEVGERIYWQGGYQSLKGFLWGFSLSGFQDEFLDEANKLPEPEVDWMGRDQLTQWMGKRDLVSPGTFNLIADQEQVEWHLAKAKFYAQALNEKPIQRIGASRNRDWILWMHDFVGEQLLVLWLEVHNHQDARHLISAGLKEVADYGFQRILVWPNPSQSPLLEFGRRAPFLDIPMILPISPELRARDWTSLSAVHRF